MKRVWFCLAWCLCLAMGSRGEDRGRAVGLRLAESLLNEGDSRGAGLELRRLAMDSDQPGEAAGYYWATAYAYLRAGEHGLAEQMLDKAEDAGAGLPGAAVSLLRGENALAAGKVSEAEFYFEAVTDDAAEAGARDWVFRRMAEVHLRNGAPDQAMEAAGSLTMQSEEAEAAVMKYQAGKDKSPAVGGWLGIIPGLGYLYAGEYANAVRSLILNSVFIFGMVDTAQDDQWGAFAVITFFEFTWYSGSIYGGIDASHRYNRDRLEETISTIRGNSSLQPDFNQLPVISFRFTF